MLQYDTFAVNCFHVKTEMLADFQICISVPLGLRVIHHTEAKNWLNIRQGSKRSSPDSLTNIKPLSANPTKWSNTLKQFVGNLPTNCLSVFDHFVIWALKGLREFKEINFYPSLKSSRGDRSKLIRLNSLNTRS